MNIYYVYEWIRLDTNEPFYVGKGCNNRCYILTRGNNKHFNNIVESTPCVVNILHNNLDEQTALDLEVWYIWQYRDIIGYDLVNINDGGVGNSGFHHSDESKEKIKVSTSGEKNHFFGRHHTEEVRNKQMIEKGKKIIGINIETNEFIIFNSIREAHRKGFNRSCISECLNGGRQSTHKGYKWYYLKLIEL